MIYARIHKSENHKYEVTRCATKKKEICIYIVPKCINCGSNHQTIAFKRPVRQKTQEVAQKCKAKKAQNRGEKKTLVESNKDKEAILKPVEIELNINTNQVENLKEQSLDLNLVEESGPKNVNKL